MSRFNLTKEHAANSLSYIITMFLQVVIRKRIRAEINSTLY